MRATSVALHPQAVRPRHLSSVFLWAGLSVLGCGGDAEPTNAAESGASSTTLAGRPSSTGDAGAIARAGDGAAAGGGAGSPAQAGRGAGSGGNAAVGGMTASGGAGVAGIAAPAGAGAGGTTSAGSGGAGGSSSAEHFSFFLASQAGLAKLSGNELGFGGDLRFGKSNGLDGADEICKQLAETSMPSNGKTWRAFLSVTKGPEGKPVNAIDRIGSGPWYDRLGRVFAMDKPALMSERPIGIDSKIANDLPNEEGVPNHDPGTGIVDNHNVLTGSTEAGTLDDEALQATCQDWTSSAAAGGKPRCGVSWPRSDLVHWASALNEGGCAPGATPPGADRGTRETVGALGGYGGFYCFALTP